MKFAQADFRKIQISALACIVLIVAGAGGVYFAHTVAKAARADRTLAQNQRNDIDNKLKRVRNEETEIKEKSALFHRISAQGIIGEEQRLEWIELLKAVREKRKLIDLRYELEPQRPLDGAAGSGFSFFVSPMRVHLELLHEEDLTRFLDDLRGQAKALIQPRNCLLSRQANDRSSAMAAPHLFAECRIDWITLRETRPEEKKK